MTPQPQPSISPEALALHRELIVMDGHSDLLMPITDGLQRLADTPDRSQQTTWQCTGQYSIPGFIAGGVSAQICAIYLEDQYLSDPLNRTLKMIGALQRELQQNPDTLMFALNADDILRAKQQHKTALVLGFEGAEPLQADLTLLDAYYALGLRVIGLTHSRRNRLADGTQQGIHVGGLTKLGFAAVERMNQLGILIDLAHLGEPGFWEVVMTTQAPVVHSHTAPSVDVPGYRQRFDVRHPQHGLTKLEALAKVGGLVGIIFYSMMTLDAIVSEIEFVIERVGEDHVALGSDFYGRDAAPPNLNDIGDLPHLTQRLLERGHSHERIAKIMGGNWMRVWREVTRRSPASPPARC